MPPKPVSSPRRLRAWRLSITLGICLLIGLPLAAPLLELVTQPAGWQAWAEWRRLFVLAGSTMQLTLGTALVALPLGIVGGIVLYRSDMACAGTLRVLNILAMFVPLSLFASAWQATLGIGGWLFEAAVPWLSASDSVWRPWPVGMPAAICVHAIAALPWVIWIVGHGLCAVERELEEDALTFATPCQVMFHISLSRSRAYIWVAACCIFLQTATEITVTDVMQVQTFAEEVYTQLVVGDEAAVARSLAAAVPMILIAWGLLGLTVYLLAIDALPLQAANRRPFHFRFSSLRGIVGIVALAAYGALILVPVTSLVWKVGLAGRPLHWSAGAAAAQLWIACRLQWPLLLGSLIEAGLAGAVLALVGLLTASLIQGARWSLLLVLAIAALAWAEPAPAVGLGLKKLILTVVDWDRSNTLASLLYDRPSLLPVLWVHVIRFLPIAIILVWPAVFRIPREIKENTLLDGVAQLDELRLILAPLTVRFLVLAGIAIAILALGEIGAGKLVHTPGMPTVALEVFYKMHYGVTGDLAALCLMLLGLVAATGGLLKAISGLLAKRRRNQL
jgi:iron(III) transport system permease protein